MIMLTKKNKEKQLVIAIIIIVKKLIFKKCFFLNVLNENTITMLMIICVKSMLD